jgi:hypothetical protein
MGRDTLEFMARCSHAWVHQYVDHILMVPIYYADKCSKCGATQNTVLRPS